MRAPYAVPGLSTLIVGLCIALACHDVDPDLLAPEPRSRVLDVSKEWVNGTLRITRSPLNRVIELQVDLHGHSTSPLLWPCYAIRVVRRCGEDRVDHPADPAPVLELISPILPPTGQFPFAVWCPAQGLDLRWRAAIVDTGCSACYPERMPLLARPPGRCRQREYFRLMLSPIPFPEDRSAIVGHAAEADVFLTDWFRGWEPSDGASELPLES